MGLRQGRTPAFWPTSFACDEGVQQNWVIEPSHFWNSLLEQTIPYGTPIGVLADHRVRHVNKGKLFDTRIA